MTRRDVLQPFKKRQERDWSSRPGFVSCRHFEQLVDEVNLSPNIRPAHPPRLSRPTPVVLDDGHPADLARRRELFRVLRVIGVDVGRLVRYLRQRPDRALLIKERRAHVYEMQAKAGRPLSRVLLTGFERYANRLKAQGCPLPPRVDNAVFELFNALEASVNAITDRFEGEPPASAPSSYDRTAARYAAERRRLQRSSGVHTRMPAPQPPRVDRTEPLAPLPNRLVGDRHASLREEIFGIAEAEAEPMVEPDRVADDVGQESISMIAGRLAPHRPTLPLVASI